MFNVKQCSVVAVYLGFPIDTQKKIVWVHPMIIHVQFGFNQISAKNNNTK